MAKIDFSRISNLTYNWRFVLRNRRLITFILIGLTLILGGLAIFLAITINNRRVNPDDTAAVDPCGGCPGGHYCDSTTCTNPPHAFCCPNDQACGCPIAQTKETRIVDRGTRCGPAAGCPEGLGKQMRDSCEVGKDGQLTNCTDASDADCTPKPGCPQPDGTNPACPRSAIPNCGQGNARVGETCTCQSQGTDRFTGIQVCTETGWSICARADGQQTPRAGCPSGMRPVNGVCVRDCDGNSNICACGNNLCSGTAGQRFTCSNASECQVVDSGAWAGSGNCRVAVGPGGSVGECARAEFRSCNPPAGQMCLCSGLGAPINGYRYGNTTTEPVGRCGSSCEGKSGGIYVAEVCGNPYRCPDTPTFRPPPCTPSSYCDPVRNQRVDTVCHQDGSKSVIYTPEECGPCPVTRACQGCDAVEFNCHGQVIRRIPNSSECPCTTTTREEDDACSFMTVTVGGQSITVNSVLSPNVLSVQLQPGQEITFNSGSAGPNANFSHYWMRPYGPEDGCAYYIFNPDTEWAGSPQRTFRLPGNLQQLERNDAWGRANCRGKTFDYTKGVIFGVNYLRDGRRWEGNWCRNIGPNPSDSSYFNASTGSLNRPCPRPNPCVVRTLPPLGACSSMTVSIGDQTITVNNINSPNVLNVQLQPGQQITFNSSSTGPGAYFSHYWMRPYRADPNDPINRQGTREHICAYYIFNFNQDLGGSPQRTFTIPNNLNALERNDLAGSNGSITVNGQTFSCRGYAPDYTQGVIFGVNYIQNPTQWGGEWCSNQGPNPGDSGFFNGSINLNRPCPTPNVCVVRTQYTPPPPTTPPPPAPQCTSITIQNQTRNTSCNASNPNACNVMQGDQLNVSVTGSGTITRYGLTTQVIRGQNITTNNPTTQESSQFNSITVPTGNDITGFAIRGSVENVSGSQSSDNCFVRFTFTQNPEIQKTINRAGSNPAIPESMNPVVVSGGNVVEYDITVRNNGNSVLQNVLVYDRVINLNNGNVDLSGTPIGAIVRATNLTRTTGSSSTPNPVAPAMGYTSNAVPFTGTTVSPNNSALPNDNFSVSQNVRLVRWSTITSFVPGEVYTGKVRVEIQSFSGNPGLRNQVCLVIDSNNNGQFDNVEMIRCSEVDVFTAQPQFTIEKTVNNNTANPGDTITYTITLRNTSNNPLNLNNVTITDAFDTNYFNRVNITPGNGGEIQNSDRVVWTGSDLVTANGNNANLAPNATLSVTMQVRFNPDFFNNDTTMCQTIINNVVTARSTSPEFDATSTNVTVNLINPNCGAIPTQSPTQPRQGPTSNTLPKTSLDIPVLLPVISVIAIVVGVTGLIVHKRLHLRLSRDGSSASLSQEPRNIKELRKKFRVRKRRVLKSE
ncbi:MAG: hypothetical protein KatS3mg084_0114 [Candidatus Dojkabacteria bacterium]|nr:MAG: hypothetical protein KatS3mg084_0114 [Candidatus Dojkabacteria bacterium]